MSDVRDMAIGRWRIILPALGIEERFLIGRNGPCPFCGGRDRYRFSDYQRRGGWYCSQCGKGDGFDLLMRWHGWSFAEAAKEIKALVPGMPEAPQVSSDEKREKAAKALNKLREESVPASKVPEVERYLSARGLIVPPGIQAHPALAYYDGGKQLGKFPAMLGRLVLASGKPVTYHRTYLKGGRKADVRSPKKVMTPTRNSRGGAVRLFPADEVVGIAEGIETAIAAHLLFGIPTWSVLHAEGMIEFDPPEHLREIVIFGDADESFTGQAAAYTAAKRLKLAPEYRKRDLTVTVYLPDEPGDWNDALLARRAAA